MVTSECLDHRTCLWVDIMAINDLPEIGDGLVQPIYDQQTTNVTALVLTNNAIENKLCGDLTESISSARYSAASFNVQDAEIKRVRDHIASTPVSASLSQFEKDSLLSDKSEIIDSARKFAVKMFRHTDPGQQAIRVMYKICVRRLVKENSRENVDVK